jgi:hypothetical protein
VRIRGIYICEERAYISSSLKTKAKAAKNWINKETINTQHTTHTVEQAGGPLNKLLNNNNIVERFRKILVGWLVGSLLFGFS